MNTEVIFEQEQKANLQQQVAVEKKPFDGLIRPEIIQILEWKEPKKSVIVLALINVLFIMINLLGNSVISLLVLFLFFLEGAGLILHLVYMATSVEDYRLQTDALIEEESPKRKEHVPPESFMPPLLILFECSVRLKSFYNDIITVKNYEQTFTVLASLPFVWVFLYYTRLPDSFIVWIAVNAFYLHPIMKRHHRFNSLAYMKLKSLFKTLK